MRRSYILLAVALLFAAMPAFAQNSSSKAAAAINQITYCANTSTSQSTNPCTVTNQSTSATSGVWYNVMVTNIKASNVTDLFVSPSLVTGLYTDTTVKGNKDGTTSTAVAEGTVKVRVLLDPPAGYDQQGSTADACQSLTSGDCNGTVAAYPDTTGAGVTFDQRIQTLSANLGFIFGGAGSACLTNINDCTPEQIQLILDTTSAHTFNYILLNVGSGMHTVVVQAEVDTSNTSIYANSNGGTSVSNALFGLGSLTVDAVRLVNSFSF